MNYANRKTTLKDWKSTIISVGVVMNLFLGTVIINQNEEILHNQKTILEKENNTYYAIGDAVNYLSDETYKAVDTIIIPEDISCRSGIKSKNNITEYSIPNYDTSFKAYMDYNCITDDTTKQWELQQTAYTDEYGLRKVGTDYCVAVGSYYSETVGERFKITLDNGNEFTVIISDLKQDKHTDLSNRYSPVYDENGDFYSANVLEFIVDEDQLHSMVTTLGTVSYYSEFEGNIVSIEKI